MISMIVIQKALISPHSQEYPLRGLQVSNYRFLCLNMRPFRFIFLIICCITSKNWTMVDHVKLLRVVL